jgi:hypothetical protein
MPQELEARLIWKYQPVIPDEKFVGNEQVITRRRTANA